MKKKAKILIATTNSAKKKYLEWVIEDLDFNIVYLDQLKKKINFKETGKNFKENAELKASQYSNLVDYLTICSDGGLIIPILGNNWNSLLTHRFAGEKASDLDRVNELLKIMQKYKGQEREIYFQDTIALAQQGQVLFSYEARSGPRHLSHSYNPEKFIKGFWVANLIYYPELKKHYTELSKKEKLKIPSSHWQGLKEKVEEFIKERLK